MNIDAKLIGQEAKRLGISRKEAMRRALLKSTKNPDLEGLKSLREASEETGLSIANLYYRAINKNIRSVFIRIGHDDKFFIPEQEVLRIKTEVKKLADLASNKDLMTPLEAARELGMNRVHLYQHLLSGRIKSIRYGLNPGRKMWFIPRTEVEKAKRDKDVSNLIVISKVSQILRKSHSGVDRIIREKKLEVINRPGVLKGRYISQETFEAIKAAFKEKEESLKGLIPIKEAAQKLGVTRQALYLHYSNGHLKGVHDRDDGKRRGRVYISKDSLEEFIRRTRRDGRNHLAFTKFPNAVTPMKAAEMIGCTKNDIYGYISRGQLVPDRVPGLPGSRGWVVIRQETIDEFLKKYGSQMRRRACSSCRKRITGSHRKGWRFCPFCGKEIK